MTTYTKTSLITHTKKFSEADLDVPMFDGESYMSAPIPPSKSIRHVTTFSLDVKTNTTDGMLIWIGEVWLLYKFIFKNILLGYLLLLTCKLSL